MTTILLLIHLWSLQAGFATVDGDPAVVQEHRRALRSPMPYATLTMQQAQKVCEKSKQEFKGILTVQVECRYYEVQMFEGSKDRPPVTTIHRIGGVEREP